MLPAVYAFVYRERLTKPTIHTWSGRPMPHPDMVIVATEPDGIFLYRYTAEVSSEAIRGTSPGTKPMTRRDSSTVAH